MQLQRKSRYWRRTADGLRDGLDMFKGIDSTDRRIDLLRVLRFTLWLVPSTMGVIGLAYTLAEHINHRTHPAWPWPSFLAGAVLGFTGPILTWIALRWAVGMAEKYLASQEEIAQRADELVVLNKLIVASRSLDLEKTLSTILDKTMDALDASAGMLFVQDNGSQGLNLETHRGIPEGMARKEAQLNPGHCLCGQAVESRQVLFAPEIEDDPRCTSDMCICAGFKSVACAPLHVNDQLVGLIQLASPKVGHFSEKQHDFLNAAAAQVSVSIENARLYDQVQSFNLQLENKITRRTAELEAARQMLAKKATQLQDLLYESYRIQEETQERIAHDMHDGVTQTIIGAIYEIQAAQDSLIRSPAVASVNLTRAQELLAEVDQEIRRVIYDLHPPVLSTMGLVVATKRFAASCSSTFDFGCRVIVEGKHQRLGKHTETTIYRIIQSAMQNIAAHSQSDQACVLFTFDPDIFQVTIEDNGIGFDPQATLSTPAERLGLIGMIERAESLGASLTIQSKPGRGSMVAFRLPAPEYVRM